MVRRKYLLKIKRDKLNKKYVKNILTYFLLERGKKNKILL